MKKTFIFCLIGLMIVSLCACGGQKSTTYTVEIDGKTYHADSKEEAEAIVREHTTGEWEKQLDAISQETKDAIKNKGNMLEVTSGGYDGVVGSYHEFYFKVKNISDIDMNTVTININILDENGDIVDTTHPQEPATVKPGQSIYIEGLSKDSRGAVAVAVDSYSFYDAQKNYYQGTVNDSLVVKFGA